MSSRLAGRRLRPDFPPVRAALAALSMLLAGMATASAQTITTVAGGAATCASASALAISMEPSGTAVDAAGNVYVAVAATNAICKITPAGAISRYAGTGTGSPGFSGDGGAATAAELSGPTSVAMDSTGNLYIADGSNHRIRKVTSAGVISTIAGDGIPSFSGDGGAATSAHLNFPSGLAFDGTGILYFSDTLNHRVRMIATNGTIGTLAGNGTPGYSGDGGAATAAQLKSPWGVAVDGTTVYVADRLNHRIRKISAGTIGTVAGTGTAGASGDAGLAATAQLNTPHGVVVDTNHNLYIADSSNHRIRKITAADGKIATIIGSSAGFAGDGGPAASAKLNYPQNLAIDGSANLYIADYFNYRVRKFDAAGGGISTLAGNGAQGYSGDGGAATGAQLGSFLHVATDFTGNLYVSDSANHRVRKLASDGTISTVAGNGAQGAGGDNGPATAAQLNSPAGIAFDKSGNLYIADQFNNAIRKVASNGTISTVAAGSLMLPFAVTVDGAGSLYISDTGNSRIRKVATDGTVSTVAGNGTQGYAGDGGPALNAQLNNPRGLVLDSVGNLYIADVSNHRVRRVGTDGNIATFAGNGGLGPSGDGGPATDASLLTPNGLALDPLGQLHIADYNKVRKVVTNGTIQHVAGFFGNGSNSGFAGDGGPAVDALLNQATGVAFDRGGNLYIADSTNRRVRKVAALSTPSVTGLRVDTPATGVYGQSLAITVTVSANYLPTGKVDVCLDGDPDPAFFCWPHFVLPCTGLPLSPGANPGEYVATCTTSTIPLGDHSIAAYFSGDAFGSAAANLAPTLTVNPAATAISVTSIAPGSIVLGQSATVTAALSVTAPGSGTPSGTITISDGTVSCSYSTPASNNCSITPTGTGAKTISASYSGDADFLASTTTSQYLLVNSAPLASTITTLSLAPNPVAANQAVAATVTVSTGQQPTAAGHVASAAALPAAATGSVVVSGGGHQCTAALNGGAGNCTLSFATPGSYAITASYSGDAQNAPSADAANLTVTAVPQTAAAVPAPMLSWWTMLALCGALVALTRRATAKA